MTMTVSTQSTSSARPRSACAMRRLPSKANGLVTTATVSAPSLAGERGDDRRGAGAGAAAEAGGDEDHVGAFERLDDLVGVFERGLAADFGIGAGAEAVGELGAELDLHRAPATACSACRSVLAAMNSTPSSLARRSCG